MTRIKLNDLPSRNQIQKTLNDLARRYPLKSGSPNPSFRINQVDLGEFCVGLIKLKLSSFADESAMGSAGDVNQIPTRRAYFELIERLCLPRHVFDDEHESVAVYDENNQLKGHLDYERIIPGSPDPERWRVSPTNGMAAHTRFESALRNSAAELVERHQLLLGWFDFLKPRPVDTEKLKLLPESTVINQHYDLLSCTFEKCETNIGSWYTSVVGGIPRGDKPVIYGFGAGENLDQALKRSEIECLQRFGFRWTESDRSELRSLDTSEEADPEYHRRFFKTEKGIRRLRLWMEGELEPLDVSRNKIDEITINWIDCTPSFLEDSGVVLKAVSDQTLLLTHGVGHPAVTRQLPPERRLHPIA